MSYLKCNDCDKIFSEKEIPEGFYGSVHCADCQYDRGERTDIPEFDGEETPTMEEYIELEKIAKKEAENVRYF